MKLVNDVLTKIKGDGNVSKIIPGKGVFSKAGYGDLVHALVNDTTHKVEGIGKDGKEVKLNISELIRADLKKTLENAKYPQKSEAAILNTVDICTTGLAEATRYFVREQIESGKKFEIAPRKDLSGSIYLTAVPGKTKTSPARDIKTQEDLGTTTVTTKDHVQVRAKGQVPKHLKTKVRHDKNGHLIK